MNDTKESLKKVGELSAYLATAFTWLHETIKNKGNREDFLQILKTATTPNAEKVPEWIAIRIWDLFNNYQKGGS